MKTRSKGQAIRQLIANEAARMLANHESSDFKSARRKAAARLGCKDQRYFPENADIDSALRDYLQLFKRSTQPEALRQLRQRAVEVMQELKLFSPRLVGAVLDGTADATSPVQLYLFPETIEELVLFLMERRIPFIQKEINLKHASGDWQIHELIGIQAGDNEIELILLSPVDRANPPLSFRTERPNPGAGLSKVKNMLED